MAEFPSRRVNADPDSGQPSFAEATRVDGLQEAGPPPRPVSVIFLQNDLTAVFDEAGKQIPHFQVGRHGDTIRALRQAGYDWRQLQRTGEPTS